MKELLKAMQLQYEWNKKDVEEIAKIFAEYSNQEIPQEAIDKFRFLGMLPTDFLESDWLNKFGLKNIYQV